jgi:hypothetical protein
MEYNPAYAGLFGGSWSSYDTGFQDPEFFFPIDRDFLEDEDLPNIFELFWNSQSQIRIWREYVVLAEKFSTDLLFAARADLSWSHYRSSGYEHATQDCHKWMNEDYDSRMNLHAIWRNERVAFEDYLPLSFRNYRKVARQAAFNLLHKIVTEEADGPSTRDDGGYFCE